MKKIGILGCGWLGFSLAKSLIEDGNIKIGMKFNDLKQTLGGEGSVYYFNPL